jgi:hypothetical protein
MYAFNREVLWDWYGRAMEVLAYWVTSNPPKVKSKKEGSFEFLLI